MLSRRKREGSSEVGRSGSREDLRVPLRTECYENGKDDDQGELREKPGLGCPDVDSDNKFDLRSRTVTASGPVGMRLCYDDILERKGVSRL
jgi:hypothetical protein